MQCSSTSDDVFFETKNDFAGHIQLLTVPEKTACKTQAVIASKLSQIAHDEYLGDIIQHMMDMQAQTLPDVTQIDVQPEIQWHMRPYLIDFLVEVHAVYDLLPEVLFLAINLLDRYCSRRVVFSKHYQLVGCTALLIAAKYSDKAEHVPQIEELAGMCCDIYNMPLFIQMEMHILNALEWVIGHPTASFFLDVSITEQGEDLEVKHMAAYMCEIALYHRDFISIEPSTMTQVSLTLARNILGRPEEHEREWTYIESLTLLKLSQCVDYPSPTLAQKYAQPSMSGVSQKLALFLERQCDFVSGNATPSVSMMDSASFKPIATSSTPQKLDSIMSIDAYLTPPITPQEVAFGNHVLGGVEQPPGTQSAASQHQYFASNAQHTHQQMHTDTTPTTITSRIAAH